MWSSKLSRMSRALSRFPSADVACVTLKPSVRRLLSLLAKCNSAAVHFFTRAYKIIRILEEVFRINYLICVQFIPRNSISSYHFIEPDPPRVLVCPLEAVFWPSLLHGLASEGDKGLGPWPPPHQPHVTVSSDHLWPRQVSVVSAPLLRSTL